MSKWICKQCYKEIGHEVECFTDANFLSIPCELCGKDVAYRHVCNDGDIPRKQVIMQCKDISTGKILQFVFENGGIGCNWFGIDEFENERSVRHAMPPGLPDNLVRAKMNKLIAKGYIDGCNCGCRGDYKITQKGLEHLILYGSGENLPVGILYADAIIKKGGRDASNSGN